MKEKKGGNSAVTQILLVAVITGIVASSVPPVSDLDISIVGLRAWSGLILISTALLYLKGFLCGFFSEAVKSLAADSRSRAPHTDRLFVHVADCVLNFAIIAFAFLYCVILYPESVKCSSLIGLVLLAIMTGISTGVISYIHKREALKTE